jgi:hypothetical protein
MNTEQGQICCWIVIHWSLVYEMVSSASCKAFCSVIEGGHDEDQGNDRHRAECENFFGLVTVAANVVALHCTPSTRCS